MGRFDDVLTGLSQQIADALNNGGVTIPNQVGVGKPNFEDLTKIIKAGQMQTTLYPEKAGRNVTRFFSQLGVLAEPVVTLVATVTDFVLGQDLLGNDILGDVLTFSGTPTSGLNIHTLVSAPTSGTADAYCATVNADTLTTIATKCAAAVTALAIPGVAATPSGAAVSFTGLNGLKCNIGGTGTLAQIALQLERNVQVTFWMPDPHTRYAVENAIIPIGSSIMPRYFLPDGSPVRCRLVSPNVWSDDRQLDGSMYQLDAIYCLEYAAIAMFPATQIGAFIETIKTPGSTITLVEG